ncbi:MAG: hypothetical protein AAGB35_04560 [Pseudomonadota bacterium]
MLGKCLILLLFIGSNSVLADQILIDDLSSYLYLPPPKVTLTADDEYKLEKGHYILKEISVKHEPTHLIIFRVQASKQDIWKTITNYPAYPNYIKNVKKTNVYQHGDNHYYVEFGLSHWLLGKYTYFVKHYLSDDSWMKWTLDPSKQSDFSLSLGYWQVLPVKQNLNSFDIVYSADLRFQQAKSAFTRNRVIKAGLKQTSFWVRREAESQ